MAGNRISNSFKKWTLVVVSGACAMVLLIPFNAGAQAYCGWRSFSTSQPDIARIFWQADDNEFLYVPIVFHIVLQDPSIISDDLIRSQLQVINEDFARTNADATQTIEQFKEVAGNPNIQFYFATHDDATGITRTPTVHGPFSNDDLHVSTSGGKDAWDPKKFLNVWVADLGQQLFGYGASPGTPSFKDGIAIDHKYFGKNPNGTNQYNLGRTLTHEIGHWLGLQHPWGNGGCDSSDGVDDTPQQDAPIAGCNLQAMACGTLTMVQNFMNTSYDACMNLFTRQQSALMRTTLKTHRAENYQLQGPITSVSHEDLSWEVFPNPLRSGNKVMIYLPDYYPNQLTIVLTDIVGNPHQSIERFHKTEIEIDFTGKPNGVYLATISGRGVNHTEKIIVHRQL